jgi:hypothetical protein
MLTVNSGFNTRKKFSENYPQFGHVPSKRFATLLIVLESLKNIVLKARQIISLPGGAKLLTFKGAPTCFWPALHHAIAAIVGGYH